VVWTIEYAASLRQTFKKLDPRTRLRLKAFLEDRIANLDDPRSTGKR